MRHTAARSDLRSWLDDQPGNFFHATPQIRRLLERLAGAEALDRWASHLDRFGKVAATVLDEAAIVNNRAHNLPRLDRWSDIGERTEDVEHHPSNHVCGRSIYQDGRVIAVYEEPPANLLAQTLFWLSSHVGEAGHNCPVACTAGIARALQGAASDELRDRYLPGVLSDRYEDRLDGAQFLTEVQGGSDVGANTVRAEADGEAYGTTRWRIFGEKWFCSNADADLILMTARVDDGAYGTGGLGLFLVPRRLNDGTPNGYTLRRLKDKLGTRSMPSAEIDFDGAVAYAIGDVADGFKHVMTWVINTSRLYNTVGCAGIARRAHLVAKGYAEARRAFGQPIAAYPMVQEMLAHTYATSAALTAGALDLANTLDLVEGGALSDDDTRAWLRVATNLAKMRSCQHSHRVVLTGIETLGGNGAIESFSVLPRLLRDNVVYENWEGTHNTLVAQTVRDFGRYRMHEALLRITRARLDASGAPDDISAPIAAELSRCEAEIAEALGAADPGVVGLMLKPALERMADAIFAIAWAGDVASERDDARSASEWDAVRFFVAHQLGSQAPVRNAGYAAMVATVAGL